MNRQRLLRRIFISPLAVLLFSVSLFFPNSVVIGAEGSDFSRSSMDVTLLVHDIEKSLEFYRTAIGFQKTRTFSMPRNLAEAIGFPDDDSVKVHVLSLGKGKEAANLKLIALPKSEKGDGQKASSRLTRGFRHITIFVTDIESARKKLEKAKVKPSSHESIKLGKGLTREFIAIILRDPEGNLVELAGPRPRN